MYNVYMGRFISRDGWMQRSLNDAISPVQVLFPHLIKYEEKQIFFKKFNVFYLKIEAGGDFGPMSGDGYVDGVNLYFGYLVPNKLDYNGEKTCGSGWNEPLVPDNPIGHQFSPCCEGHDKCYDTCGKNQEECDNAFLLCMRNAVDAATPGNGRWDKRRRDQGYWLAHKYYDAVHSMGKSAFDEAQKKCDCKKSGQ